MNPKAKLAIVMLSVSAGCGPGLLGCDASDDRTEAKPLSFEWSYPITRFAGWSHLAHPIAFDLANNLTFAIAATDAPNGGQCTTLTKLRRDGSLIWSKPVDELGPIPAPFTNCREGVSLAHDSSGALVLASTVTQHVDKDSIGDIMVRKLSADGETLWTQYHDGDASELDRANNVSIDSQGQITVAGAEEQQNPFSIPWVGRYDPSGALLWMRSDETTAGEALAAYADTAGDVTMLIQELDGTGNVAGFTLAKRAADGSTRWQTSLGGAYPSSAGVDANGEIVLLTNVGLVKYSAEGTQRWSVESSEFNRTHIDGSKYNITASLANIAIGADGSIYGVGGGAESRVDVSGPPLMILWKFDADGVLQWIGFHNPWGCEDIAIGRDDSIAVGCDGTVGLVRPPE